MKNGILEAEGSKKRISNDNEEKVLIQSAEVAASKALRSSHALGLTVKIIRDNQIISVHPDKTETPGRTIVRRSVNIPNLKKGSVLKKK